jgi:hypothetical protein
LEKNEKTILIIAANPKDTPHLRIDKEIKEIKDSLRTSDVNFKVELQMASSAKDLRRAILKTNPCIIHFCGHGHGESGIALEDETGHAKLVSTDAITNLFKLFSSSVECVLFNACYSDIQAKTMMHHIDYVIGMNSAIGDKAAIEFASGFYDAIGAKRPYELAYQFGCNAIEMEGIPEHHTPVFLTKQNQPVKTTGLYHTFESKTVFLAEVSDDLYKQRMDVKSYLEQHNITVVPNQMYHFNNAEALVQQIDQDLEKSDLYVQLFSDTSPIRPEGMSTPELQYDRAMQFNKIPIMTWRDKKLDLSQMQDSPLLNILNASTMMAALLQDLKEAIVKKLKHMVDCEQETAVPKASSDHFVFINTSSNPDDITLANEIFTLLQKNGVYPTLPVLENIKPAEKRLDLEENLETCDAVIILYVHSNIAWVRSQLTQCRKMIRKRKGDPLRIIGVYDQPGPDKPDLGMSLPNLEILECPSLHADTCIPKFLKTLGIANP